MTRHRPHHEVELYRDEDAYVVIVDVSNYDPANVDVTWDDGQVVVTADPVVGEPDERRVGVPGRVDPGSIETACEAGVLEVRLPIAVTEADGAAAAH